MGMRSYAIAGIWFVVALSFAAASQPGEEPALGSDRISQAELTGGELSLEQIRREGLRIFTTLFNKLDGYGDGPMNVADPARTAPWQAWGRSLPTPNAVLAVSAH